MNYESLDRMGFADLYECLKFVLGKIQEIKAEVGKDADDPRLDRLFLVANKIIMRANALVQEGSVPTSAEGATVWNKLMPEYDRRYQRYMDTFQDEEILFDDRD